MKPPVISPRSLISPANCRDREEPAGRILLRSINSPLSQRNARAPFGPIGLDLGAIARAEARSDGVSSRHRQLPRMGTFPSVPGCFDFHLASDIVNTRSTANEVF